MNFRFNAYHKPEVPLFYLAYPNKKIIGQLSVTDKQADLCFNNISSISLTVNKRENGTETNYYDDIQLGKYIFADPIGWFKITASDETVTDDNAKKNIAAHALQIELAKTYLTSFGSLGTDDDTQGGLDRYCLYSPIDDKHSILHVFMEKNPAWSVGYIDPAITKQYRSFDNDRISSYDFLIGDVADTFECIFQFDSDTYSVSAYKVENIGRVTDIYLSYLNLIKSTKISFDEENIKTLFYVNGGNDSTGTPLNINTVNPSGNNYITNFSYFYKDMSEALKEKLIAYSEKMDENQELYQNGLTKLQNLYDELSILNTKVPEDGDSVIWSEYGLIELQAKEKKYKSLASLYVDKSSSEEYKKYNGILNKITSEIVTRRNQISEKESEIESQTEIIKSYIINIQNFLGKSLYEELSHFIYEDVLVDNSYIATSIMTQSEIIEMQLDLLEHAKEELKKVCFPHFSMNIDSINFPMLFQFKDYADELNLGDIVTINYYDTHNMRARLLKVHINWNDPNDFSLTFSSKTHLEDDWFEYNEIKDMASSASGSLNLSSSAWNSATKTSSDFLAYKKDILDLSLQNLQSSKDQEILIDHTGVLAKMKLPNGLYDPKQLWITNRNLVMTDDNWKSAKLAIGNIEINGQSIYGIAADVIAGNFIFSNTLVMSNKNNSITMDDNGFLATAKNGYSLSINPDNPKDIFNIKKDKNTILGIDAETSKFVFRGTADISDGKIGGYTIGLTTLTSGGVGLNSASNANTIAIWAGNVNANIAPFRVSNDGTLIVSKLKATGGTISIGDKFNLSDDGAVTCNGITAKNGTFTGVNILSGTIGGFKISGNDLSVPKGVASIDFGGDVFIDRDGLVVGNWWFSNEEISCMNAIIANNNGDLFVHGSQYFSGQTVARALDDLRRRLGSGGCGSDCSDCGDSCSYDGGGCDDVPLVDDVNGTC